MTPYFLIRMKSLLSGLFACLLLMCAQLHSQSFKMEKVRSFEDLSNTDISKEWGKLTLTEEYFDPLKHVETEHFIIHYERSPSKIARRAEGIYAEIMEFMGNPEDKAGDKKSHIYVIPDYPRWQKWCLRVAKAKNIGGVCWRNEFYFPAEGYNGKFDTDGRTLNHEMTHMVFNRIFPRHVPTWLNEGVAEFFGERETMSTTKFRAVMGRRMGDWDLDDLTKYENGYGDLTGASKTSFYAEASIFVDFLTHKHDKKQLVEFINSTMDGGKLKDAATAIYKYESYAALKEEYKKYRRKFK